MSLEKYNIKTDETYLEYEFYSEGPKGRIKKVVKYTRFENNDSVFNLGFGDKNEETGHVDETL